MIPVDLPLWIALPVSLLVVAGAALTLIGGIGLGTLDSFYKRIHAPTLGTSFGAIFIVLGSIVYFSTTGSRLAVHEVLILVFVTMTTPVTLMLLARAALYRDRAEGRTDVPPSHDRDAVD